ncbi:DNA polymerase III subunit psi [Colwellia echini]|uniref:DNA polymerase III subunit psi n=1 Tax=Colwellia echini TaxID=1982103 RepID=A0ABY3MXM0_9GAMM|nr:DNA polymerase III subunit psi [Colwellia echini]TYK65953.1 DNA polymerase III subunit psi [Colwellia echini]
MSINQHQFEQLTEMGISLWQQRSNEHASEAVNSQKPNTKISYLDIDLEALAKQQLFTDILLSTGLTIGEINKQGDHLDLGLFNWYFLANKDNVNSSHPANKIQWVEQQLFTPSIDEISKSPALKKQLWLLLGNQAQ